jgi:hypothetical protein
MHPSQQPNKTKFICRASFKQRLSAGLILLVTVALFSPLVLAAANKIDINRWLNPCGFKQQYGLPCPTCGITTAAIAFAGGKIAEAFYIQPAGALLCSLLVVTGVLAFITTVFGVYFGFLERFFHQVKIRHIIVAVIVVTAAGWAVTLARALAEK